MLHFRTLASAVCLLAADVSASAAAPDPTPAAWGFVSVRSYQQLAAAVGTEEEDWEPAFRAALAECGKAGRPLFVPAGVYKIRKAIDVPQTQVMKGFMNPGRLAIRGAGRMQSIIWQQVDTENVVNWSGPTYEEDFSGGGLADLSLAGGTICLNIKWHNHFSLDNCYVAGAQQFGIYAEGWSSRFNNCTIRWCRQAGIRGAGHFNNIVIRDCYFSRDRIGISLGYGNGIRIIGCGLESCSDSAITVSNASSVSIRDCYFEGNAYPDEGALGAKGATFPNVLYLDVHANNVVVSGCIFRGGKGYGDANQIGVVGGVNHTIRENRFTNCHVAVKLLSESVSWPDRNGVVTQRLCVTQNDFHCTDRVKTYRRERDLAPVGVFLTEAVEGLIDAATAAGCVFESPTLSNVGSDD